MPVWRTLCSIVVDLNINVLKHFPRLKLVLYLIVQANNLDVIFWGRNNWFCSRKCLFTSLFGQVCLFCDEMAYQKSRISNMKNMTSLGWLWSFLKPRIFSNSDLLARQFRVYFTTLHWWASLLIYFWSLHKAVSFPPCTNFKKSLYLCAYFV